jgi:hypothetical protein
MPHQPLGKVIAARELEFVRTSGEVESAWVTLGEPVQPEEGGPWHCPYQVRTPSFERTFAIAGEDSMQALILSLHVISSVLASLERQHGGVFKQYGETSLGFPHADNSPR